MKVYWILVVILFALTTGSCGPLPTANISALTPTPIPSDNSSVNSLSPINTPDYSEMTSPPVEANPFVKLVEEDLADRLGINPDQIQFLKISEIDWQDITQGCTATPDQPLKKGRVSGYRIWLEANSQNYLYHIGLDNTIFLCLN